MIDYQRVVEFLRDFRGTPGQAITDEVRRYAAEYAQHCNQANDRLRQCSVFLQQGLRSEAIHLADEAPGLLELVAALDLPDAEGWTEFCQQNDLPVPPPLQIERAARLNDAYGQEQPLDALLRRHRRLALSRAPVKERLQAIRQIAAADTTSSFWEKDIRAFEKAQLKELKVAFALAMEARDGPALAVLADEVLKTPWLEEAPADLRAAAEGTESRLRLINASAKLRKLMGEIRAAFAAKDHSRCSRFIAQIPQIVAESNQPGVSADIAAELKPIMTWVRQEDDLLARRQDVAKAQKRLIEAMDLGAADEELDGHYQKLRGFDAAVPPELEERYHRTLRRRHSSATRKFLAVLACIVAAVLIAGAGFYLHVRSASAAGWTHKIHTACLNHKVGEAQQLCSEQERRAPQFNNDPQIVAAKQETQRLATDYATAQAELSQSLARLADAQKKGEAALAAPKIGVDQLLELSKDMSEASQRADDGGRLGWVDGEQKIQASRRNLDALADRLRDSADQKAHAAVDALAARADGVANQSVIDALQALDVIGAELDAIRRIPGLGKETAAAIDNVDKKLADRRNALGKDAAMAQRLATLRRKATSVEAWKRELAGFIAACPDARQTPDFTRASAMIDGSTAIEAMVALVQDWGDKLDVSSEAAARARLDKVKAYITAFGRSPYRPALENYAYYLDQAASAMAVKGSWEAAFANLLASPLITDLKVLTASNGNRYYVMGPLNLRNANVGALKMISFDAIDPANLVKRKTITLAPGVTLNNNDQPESLPHSRFAENLSAELKAVGPDTWENFGIKVIDEIARDKQMDAVVRAMFLEQALQTTVQIAGWQLADVYGPAIRDLARQQLANIVWFDTAKPVPDATLAALRQICESIPKPEVAMKGMKDNKAKLAADLVCRISGTGCLMKDDHGAWMVYPSGTVDAGSTVWVLGPAPAAEGQPCPWVKIASYDGGKFTVEEAAAADLPEGTFVFIRK